MSWQSGANAISVRSGTGSTTAGSPAHPPQRIRILRPSTEVRERSTPASGRSRKPRDYRYFKAFPHAIVVLVSSLLNFHLERYEGPLDLLLDLIKKQQVNIYDIPIAQITSQYLTYMQKATELDIELSSEFVFMAATLIHIKSKMLLPRDPELDRISPEEDPRTELVERLIEHERFKNAAEMLQQKRIVEDAIWSNPQIERLPARG